MNAATKIQVRARLNEAGRLLGECNDRNGWSGVLDRDALKEAMGGVSDAIAKLDALSIAEDKPNP